MNKLSITIDCGQAGGESLVLTGVTGEPLNLTVEEGAALLAQLSVAVRAARRLTKQKRVRKPKTESE